MKLAQIINNPLAPKLSPGTSGEAVAGFERVLQTIISGMLIIGILLFFFSLIIGAVKWIVSGGDKNSVESARQTITHAIIGLVVLFSLFVVAKLIEGFFGVCLLRITIPGIDSMGSGPSCITGPSGSDPNRNPLPGI